MHNLKPETDHQVKPKTTKQAQESEPLFNEIVDLDLTLFRGIGKNHQRSFERNLYSTGRLNQSFNS